MTMLPYNMKVDDFWHYRNGSTSTDRPSASRRSVRTVSSYSGAIPKLRPMPIHTFSLHVYDYSTYNVSHSKDFKEDNHGYVLSRDASYHDLSLDAADFDVLYNRALDNLNDKTRGNLDLSVDLAEAGQTARMARVFDRFDDYTSTFFRKRFGRIKSVANAWLEYAYGVKPLLGSIYGAADESLRTVINKTERFTGRASETVNSPRLICDSIFGNKTLTTTGPLKRSVTVGIVFTQPDFNLARWSSLNPLSIAWELLPYSFVVDWFYNVGGTLRNYETSLLYGNQFNTGYRTNLQVWNLTIDNRFLSADGYVSNDTGYSRGTWIDRTLLDSYPSPSLPSFKASLGSSRLLSAASLLAQHLGSRR